MKILWVTREEIFNSNTGAKMAIRNRIEQMTNSMDCNVEVISVVDRHEEKKKIDCQNIRLNYFRRQKKGLLNFLKTIILYWPIPYTVSNRINNDVVNEIKKAILERKIEFIIFEHIHTAYYQERLLDMIEKYNIRTILGCHNIESEELKSMYNHEKSPAKRMALYITYLLMLKYEARIFKRNSFDLYYFLSKADMNFVLSRLNPEIHAIYSPPGVDLHPALDRDFEKDDNTINIGFVGVMSYVPNIEACRYFYKDVFKNLKNKHQYRFYIIGKDPSEEIRMLVEDDENVVVTGFVDSVTDYYKRMDVIVVPMVTGAGVKIKLFEALSYGKFVISTPMGIKGTDFEDGKHLAVAENSQEFIDMLESYSENASRFHETAKNGYHFVRSNYSWEKICNFFYAEMQRL